MDVRGVLLLTIAAMAPSLTYGFAGCPTNEYKVWGEFCYFFRKSPGITFDDAERECEAKGGGSKLASIHSKEENQYIFDTLNPRSNWDWWIGLKKDGKDKPFYWVDGTKLDYTNWAPGEPNDRDGSENCVEMWKNAHPGKWNDAVCNKKAVGYACKTKKVDTWKEFNGNEYYLTTSGGGDSFSWYDGRRYCQEKGGDLLSISNAAEKNQIAQWMAESNYDGPLWFGLNKLDRQMWKWSDGSQVGQQNWAQGNPRQDEFGILCGYFDSKDRDTKWKNSHCGTKDKGYVCKRPRGSYRPVTDQPTVAVPGFCPVGYFPGVGNKCFKLVKGRPSDGKMWRDAVRICRSGPGFMPDIASIHSEEETAFITSAMQDPVGSYGYWMGLYRNPKSTSTWRWADSSDNDYSNWAPGEPSGSVDHCGEVWISAGSTGAWNNIDCNSERGYICQTYKDSRSPIGTPQPTTPNVCQNDYIPYWGGCYKYYPDRMSWERARSMCTSDSADMVSILNPAENAAVRSMIMGSTQGSAWLGLNDAEGTGEYKWIGNWMVLFTNWGNNQPKREAGGGCVRINRDGTWEDTICTLQYGVVCKTTTQTPITIPPLKDGRCPIGVRWEEFHESCYYFETKKSFTWLDATQDCLKKSTTAYLASIHSLQENEWIGQRLKSKKANGHSWTGLVRSRRDKKFYWSDFSTLQYENWAPGEPNGQDTDENCVEYYTRGHNNMWNDLKCTQRKNYICKAPKLPPVVTPAPVPGYCLDGWVERGQQCYYFMPNRLTNWDQANDACTRESRGKGGLASVNSADEDDFIYNKMRELNELPITKNYWLGLHKKGKDSPYHWSDGNKLIYANWAPGEPNDNTGTENCVEVYIDNGSWNDHKCTEFHAYVCKMRKVPKDGYATKLSGGSVAGIALGVIVALVLLIAIVLFVLFKKSVIGNPVDTIKSGFSNPFYKQDNETNA